MALPTAPESNKFGKIAQNKAYFAAQGHSMSPPILLPIESSYTTSYQDDS